MKIKYIIFTCFLLLFVAKTTRADDCKELVTKIKNELQEVVAKSSQHGKYLSDQKRFKVKISIEGPTISIERAKKHVLKIPVGQKQTTLKKDL